MDERIAQDEKIVALPRSDMLTRVGVSEVQDRADLNSPVRGWGELQN